jgi:hypothetical protein
MPTHLSNQTQASLDLNIAFSIFNRPEVTAQTFEAIRKARPSRLFVIADGPRANRPEEPVLCKACRDIVDNGIDWPCEVYRSYSDVNLGCRLRMVTGYDWVFQTVEHCILLEDDCLPDPSFFPYCQELLLRYWDDERVMVISGDNFQNGRKRTPYSYYFSGIVHIWGWATWRRTWQKYDVAIKLWPEVKQGGWLKDIWASEQYAAVWASNFDAIHAGYDTWDHQLTFAAYINSGLCILPAVNLVTNIGFGPEATHTKVVCADSNRPRSAMAFPLHHPPFMIRDLAADKCTYAIPEPPTPKAEPLEQFYKSLDQIGGLTYKNMDATGETRFIRSVVSSWQEPTILDSGADEGQYARVVLRSCPSAKLAAFEANPTSFQKLATNLKGASVSLHNFGLSDNDQLVNDQRLRRLDDVVADLGISKINLFRIDAAGNELAVLHGAEKTIRSGLIDLIHFKFGEANMNYRTFFKDFWDFLSHQYNLYRLVQNGEIHISQYIPSFCELFAFQNVVCVRKA